MSALASALGIGVDLFFVLNSIAAPKDALETEWTSFVERDFPFFSSVLDARDLGAQWPTNNLTPRGLILNLGCDCWACFDTELLRLSVLWEGMGITPAGMAQGSYHSAGHKAPEGQEALPHILGVPWLANGLYPGWQSAEHFELVDPRVPGPDPREVGRGPLPDSSGRLKALQLTRTGVCLEYEIDGASIREQLLAKIADGQRHIERHLHIRSLRRPLWLVLGRTAPDISLSVRYESSDARGERLRMNGSIDLTNGIARLLVRPSDKLLTFTVNMAAKPPKASRESSPVSEAHDRPARRWSQSITTKSHASSGREAFVVDNIDLPLQNPWRRNVRLADIAFFPDGRAVAVTFDGDVWLISRLALGLKEVQWRRFASGLHEPLSICIRDHNIYVYDRNGIWRLRDTHRDGEADRYELFSNAFAQTAETREFATGVKLAPDGSFVISKGGQESTTTGKLNGRVLRVSADGKRFTTLGWGLRQPFIGVNPLTGLVTASDQQGHYVPATPLHIIRDQQYYGFLPGFAPREQYPAPIADPLTWIPHPINASGASQVWLTHAHMGSLNEALIHFGYNRPEIFVVRMNPRGSRPQAAVLSLTQDLHFAPLNGAVNPADGQLYFTGFQIWGTIARQISGLARLRYTGAPSTLPHEIAAMDKGILLRFDVPLDPKKATDPANFTAERWNYRRTANYGSPHFKLDGSLGQEWLAASSAYLSKDAKSVFIGIPDMKPAMQMRIGWALSTERGATFAQNAYLTPYELTKVDLRTEGFKAVPIDLTPRTSEKASTPVTVEEGQRLAALMGCLACHSTDGSIAGKVGPTWKGLIGSERRFTEGEPAVADEAYVRESILEPTARIVVGFEKSDTGMPSYAGVLTDAQIQALILYIETLK